MCSLRAEDLDLFHLCSPVYNIDSRSMFLSLGTVDIIVGGCPVHVGYLAVLLLSVDSQNLSRHCQIFHRGQNETTALSHSGIKWVLI